MVSKLWHPRAHSSQEMVGDDPDLSDRGKYLNPNYVSEYVGGDKYDLVLILTEASHFLDTDRFESAGVRTAICGTVGYRDKGINFGLLTHLIRATDDDAEMRRRFWLGNIEHSVAPNDDMTQESLTETLEVVHQAIGGLFALYGVETPEAHRPEWLKRTAGW